MPKFRKTSLSMSVALGHTAQISERKAHDREWSRKEVQSFHQDRLRSVLRKAGYNVARLTVDLDGLEYRVTTKGKPKDFRNNE